MRSVGKKDFGMLLNALRTNVDQILGAADKGNESGALLRKNKKQQQAEMTDFGGNANASSSSQFPLPANNFSTPSSIGTLRFDHQLGMVLPDGLIPSSADASSAEHFSNGMILSGSSTAAGPRASMAYSGWTLRPLAPRRAEWLPGAAKSGRQQIKLRKGCEWKCHNYASLILCSVPGGTGGRSVAQNCGGLLLQWKQCSFLIQPAIPMLRPSSKATEFCRFMPSFALRWWYCQKGSILPGASTRHCHIGQTPIDCCGR